LKRGGVYNRVIFIPVIEHYPTTAGGPGDTPFP
jgi:hypothetical protein